MKKIPINKPSITKKEIQYVHDAIVNGWGEKCYEYILRFEKLFAQYANTTYAIATSSCTGATHLALLAMNITKGDEVIVPELTWIASAAPILYVGAKPVFADVLPRTWCIDPKSVEALITPKTKAIIAVHLYGNVCEMDKLRKIARKHNLKIIEDAAQGIGSSYKGIPVGGMGDIGAFSFHGTKTISTGEGGMVTTNDKGIYEKIRVLNDHGRNPNDPEHKTYWMREHGYKYKMSNLQAAMGCAQLERVQKLVDKKREIFSWYKELLQDMPCQMNETQPHAENGYWLPTVVFDRTLHIDIQKLLAFQEKSNIHTRPLFLPLSSLPMFKKQAKNNIAYDLYDRGMNLPSYHDMTLGDAQRVTSSIKKFLSKPV